MKIIPNSIVNVAKIEQDPLYDMSLEFMGCDVELGAITFMYSSDSEEQLLFTIELLRELYNQSIDDSPMDEFIEAGIHVVDAIDGTIKKITYQQSLCVIEESLGHREMFLAREEVLQYVDRFWDEINRYIKLPPTHVFVHCPDGDTVFSFGAFWNFCLIYLDDNNKKGIVFYGHGTD